jgi:hypothetical protein
MTRIRLALAAVIAAALLPAVGILVQAAGNAGIFRPRDDPMSAFERHLAPLREALRGEPVVGYLPPTQAVDRAAHLYSVRYALAPVQVQNDADLPLVVADGAADAHHFPQQLRVRRDFGGGLYLLERTSR